MSTPSSVKTGTHAYRCRKTLHSRRKPKDNMRGPFGDASLTRLRIIETIRRCRPNEKSGSCKMYSSFATYPFKHTHILYNSISWIGVYFKSKFRQKFVYFYRHMNVNAVYLCVYPLLGLTASNKHLHWSQSMCKTEILLMAVVVEGSAFIVDSRCQGPTFRC